MIRSAIEHLKQACLHAGLPPARVLIGKSREEGYRVAPAALLLPRDGQIRREGVRVEAGPTRTRRRIYGGTVRLRLELYARSEEELEGLLTGVLLYLYAHPYLAAEYQAFPRGEITFSYVDEEGALLGEHALALEFPVEIALYDDVAWVPIRVEFEEPLIEEV